MTPAGLIRSLVFRIRHRFGWLPTGRPDGVAPRAVRRWIRGLDQCVIEPDVQVRGHAHALEMLKLGSRVAIDRSCILWIAADDDASPELVLGDRVYVGPHCFLGSHAPMRIGPGTLIGAYSYLITANHRCAPGTWVQDQGYEAAPITIGKDVWIGCHVVVLPGVTIGDHAVVGAGAVVNRDVPAGEKWAGVPAKKIGVRE